MSRRNKIYDLVKQKAKKYKEFRTNSDRSMTPNQIMVRYVEAVEEARSNSSDSHDFNSGLEKASMLMENRLKAFDPYVHIDVTWAGTVETWQELQVTGITITWSDTWCQEHPKKEKQQVIDIGHLLLEGIFD